MRSKELDTNFPVFVKLCCDELFPHHALQVNPALLWTLIGLHPGVDKDGVGNVDRPRPVQATKNLLEPSADGGPAGDDAHAVGDMAPSASVNVRQVFPSQRRAKTSICL